MLASQEIMYRSHSTVSEFIATVPTYFNALENVQSKDNHREDYADEAVVKGLDLYL